MLSRIEKRKKGGTFRDVRARLHNGLDLLVAPRATAPVVALQCWVAVGSADERPGEEGLAHIHEHMAFKGTARRSPGELAHRVEARGGEVNAWTSFDHTVFHLVLPSRWIDDGLDLLADALTASTFDSNELARELEVVQEEIRRTEDSPARRLSRALFANAFQVHPYGRAVIGTARSVRAFTREQLVAFHRAHYGPERMMLVVTGDVDEARVAARAEELFGQLDPGALPRQPRPAEPPRAGVGTVLAEPVRESLLGIAFRGTRLAEPMTPALDVLAVLLGQGDASRLQLELRRERQLASEVWAYAYTPAEPGLFVAGASLPDANLTDCARALGAQLARLAREPVAERELATAKAILEADAVHQIETAQGLARRLGYHAAVSGDEAFAERTQAAVAALTVEDLRVAAERVLMLEQVIAVAVVPRGSKAAELTGEALVEIIQGGSRSPRPRPPPAPPHGEETGPEPAPCLRPPAARAESAPCRVGERGPTLAAPELVVHTLSSGAVLLVQPDHSVPLVALRGVWPGGLRSETDRDNGVSQLLARLFTKGTLHHGATEIARMADAMACTLGGQAGRGTLGLRAELLSRRLDEGFRLFAECLAEPAFAPEEVDRERHLQVQEIRSRDDSPGAVAFELFQATLYRQHPWRMSRLGTEETIARLGPDALVAHLAARYPRSRLTLAMVGDVDPGRAVALAEELLGGAAPAGDAELRPRPEQAPEGRREARRALDRKQIHLLHGFLGLTVHDRERDALDVLVAALSGQAGRLFVELRDRRGLAYSVSAAAVEGLDPGFFAVHVATGPDKLALAREAIDVELARVLDGGISADELDRARCYLVGAHEIGLQRVAARAAALSFDTAYGLGPEHHRGYPERIFAITREDVLAAARRVLKPEQAVVAMVGPGM